VWLVGCAFWGAGLFALWLAALALLEGVSHFAGEGQILPPDAPAGRRARLAVVAWLIGGGAGAAALGALASAWGRPGRPTPLSRLAGDGLLLVGGLGLFYGVLVLAASAVHARPEDDNLYLWLGCCSSAAGLVLAPAGAWLRHSPGVTNEAKGGGAT
jgi:hypothetical protein